MTVLMLVARNELEAVGFDTGNPKGYLGGPMQDHVNEGLLSPVRMVTGLDALCSVFVGEQPQHNYVVVLPPGEEHLP